MPSHYAAHLKLAYCMLAVIDKLKRGHEIKDWYSKDFLLVNWSSQHGDVQIGGGSVLPMWRLQEKPSLKTKPVTPVLIKLPLFSTDKIRNKVE